MSSEETSRAYSDEELLAAFVGYRAETMVPKMQRQAWFNVFAFLFGPVYYAYRKLYPHAVVILVAQLAAATVSVVYSDVPLAGFFRLLNIALSLACGILFYTLYRRRALRVIERERAAESALPVNRRVAAVGETSPLAAVITLIASLAAMCALSVGISACWLFVHTSSKEAVAYDIEQAIAREEHLMSMEEQMERDFGSLRLEGGFSEMDFSTEGYRANLEVLNGLQDELAVTDDADGAAIRAIHQRVEETMDDTSWCALAERIK